MIQNTKEGTGTMGLIGEKGFLILRIRMEDEVADSVLAFVVESEETFATEQGGIVRQQLVAFDDPVAEVKIASVAEIGARLGAFNQRVHAVVLRIARTSQTQIHERDQVLAVAQVHEHVGHPQSDL